MKSILISIKPKYVAKILNREKTIEVRKKFPIDYVGWVYIYCTKEDNLCCIRKISRDRYICGKDFDIRDFPNLSSGYEGKGKVVARFWCDKVDNFYDFDDDLCEQACLDRGKILDYLGNKNGYAIHITKLEIFNYPEELSKFRKYCDKHFGLFNRCLECKAYCFDELDDYCGIWKVKIKAPQSWCYVETRE